MTSRLDQNLSIYNGMKKSPSVNIWGFHHTPQSKMVFKACSDTLVYKGD